MKSQEKKLLKRYFKGKAKVTLCLLVTFMITGKISYSADEIVSKYFKVNSTEEGASVTGEEKNNIAIGVKTKSLKSRALSIGIDTTAGGEDSIALGSGSNAKDIQSTAIGYKTVASAKSVAIGTQSSAVGLSSSGKPTNSAIAIGDRANSSGGVAIGEEATTKAPEGMEIAGIAIGKKAIAEDHGIVIGNNSKITKAYSMAFGMNTEVDGEFATALGNNARATADRTIALGNFTKATAEKSVALGEGATASLKNSIAIGDASNTGNEIPTGEYKLNMDERTPAGTTAAGVVTFGNTSLKRRLLAVAAGRISDTSTDAVNGSQLYMTNSVLNSAMSKVAPKVTMNSAGNLLSDGKEFSFYKNNATIKESFDAVAGDMMHYVSINDGKRQQNNYNNDGATHRFSIAIGTNALAQLESAVAIGHKAKVSNTVGYQGGVAIGVDALTSQDGTSEKNFITNVAIGNQAKATSDGAVSIGELASASKSYAIGLGSSSVASGKESIALGFSARAANIGDVALGANSATSRVNPTTSATITGKTYNFAGGAPVSVVSVGTSGKERQIQNLAAGRISATSTDAINGSQLFATNTAIGILNDRAVQYDLNTDGTVNKGSLTLNPDNTATQIHNVASGGTTPTNVANIGDVQKMAKASKTEVTAGTNISSITSSVDSSDNHTTYTINANGTSVSADSDMLVVKKDAKDTKNVTDYKVDLSATAKENIAKGVSANDKINTTGITFAGNAGNVVRKLGDTITIKGEGTAGTYSGVNIQTVADTSGAISIKFADAPTFAGKVTAKGFDAGGSIISNVGRATLNSDAVNMGQLREALKNISVENQTEVLANSPFAYVNGAGEELIRKVADNGTITFVKASDNTTTYTGDDITIAALNPQKPQTSTPTRINNIATGTQDNDAVNVSQLKGFGNALGAGAGFNSTTGEIIAPTYVIKYANGTPMAAVRTVENALTNLNEALSQPIVFEANTGNIKRRLGETAVIKGKAATTGTYSGDNIKTEVSDEKINIKIADAPVFAGTVTAPKFDTGSGGPSISKDGIDAGNKKITNLVDAKDDSDAVNFKQIKNLISAGATGAFALADDEKTEVKQDLGKSIQIVGDGSNITTTADVTARTLKVALNNDLSVGGSGKDGTISIKGGGKTAVTINGKDGTIALTGPVGAEGRTPTAAIGVKDGKAVLDGSDSITRIVYSKPDDTTEEVATMSDGLKFAGNTGNVIAKKLNETLKIEGKLAEGEEASGANLRVDVTDGKLNLVMAKNLKDINKIQFNGSNGMSIVGKSGLTIVGPDGKDGVNFTKEGRITNVVAGKDDTDAVNVGQLKAAGLADGEGNIKNVVSYDGDSKDTITLGKDGNASKITNLKEGEIKASSKDAVNGGQLAKVIGIEGKVTIDEASGKIKSTDGNSPFKGEGKTLVGAIEDNAKDIKKNTDDIKTNSDNIKNMDKRIDKIGETVTANSKLKFKTDGDTVSKDHSLTDILNIKGDENIKTSSSDSNNIKIELNKNINVDSVTAGNVKISKGGINAGGEKITNVKSGEISETSTDAVNGSQVYAIQSRFKIMDIEKNKEVYQKGDKYYYDKDGKEVVPESKLSSLRITPGNIDKNSDSPGKIAVGDAVSPTDAVNLRQLESYAKLQNDAIQNNSKRIENVNERMVKGLANSAAMAGIKYLEIGQNQTSVAAALGSFEGTAAVAVGVQTAPSENVRLHAQASVTPGSNSKTMLSVGAAWRFNNK